MTNYVENILQSISIVSAAVVVSTIVIDRRQNKRMVTAAKSAAEVEDRVVALRRKFKQGL